MDNLEQLKEKYKRLMDCFPEDDLYKKFYQKVVQDIKKIKAFQMVESNHKSE